MARRGVDRLALELNVAVVVFVDAAYAVEQRGLAGPVRADQAADLPPPDIEGHAANGNHATETDNHPLDRQQWRVRTGNRHHGVDRRTRLWAERRVWRA